MDNVVLIFFSNLYVHCDFCSGCSLLFVRIYDLKQEGGELFMKDFRKL